MAKDFEKGGISVQTEHIFPVIKRWLYSDKEIFLRELVSNACDAVTKLKRLASLGEVKCSDSFDIHVVIDADLGTLTVRDNGIGMTEEEIKKYINQIALSGALDFIEKYEGEGQSNDGIIGHFGLGFYSAFMVADTVEIRSLSYAPASRAAYWSCTETGEYEMGEGDKTDRGTEIILHITDAEKEFLDKTRVRAVLDKYCAFMPVEIYLDVVGEEPEKDADGKEKAKEPINDIHPLWLRQPSECTDEEYKAFYKKVFNDYRDPLFYIHINADYPLNFKGILYFPSMSHEYSNLEGQVKLYYNQVFVADNIKEVIPDYLMLLKGVLDCPELPLNVSRSYLQNSGYVSKISAHITKKIADKINSLFQNDRENYQKMWDDIKPFVEYGSIRDSKFFERVKNSVIFKTTDDEFVTKDEYIASLPAAETKPQAENSGDKKDGAAEKKKIYYATSQLQQVNYIKLFREAGYKVLNLDALIDSQFISFYETTENDISFVRIDCDSSVLKQDDAEKIENEVLKKLFEESAKQGTEIVFERLNSEKTPAIITLSEEQRRFADMMKMYQRSNSIPPMPGEEKLVVNLNCPLIKKLEALASDEASHGKAQDIAHQIYAIAVLAQRTLTADELSQFVDSSFRVLEKL